MFYISAFLLQLNKYNQLSEQIPPVLGGGRICEGTSHWEEKTHPCRYLEYKTEHEASDTDCAEPLGEITWVRRWRMASWKA